MQLKNKVGLHSSNLLKRYNIATVSIYVGLSCYQCASMQSMQASREQRQTSRNFNWLSHRLREQKFYV